MNPQTLAWIALGANLPGMSGSPLSALRQAIRQLAGLSSQPLLQSRIYQSIPKDCPPDSPVYFNCVAGLVPAPAETPSGLLNKLHHIEQQFGRTRSGITNEARVLDLDLLWFAGIELATPELILPHPRAHSRRFVLQPWLELGTESLELQGRKLGDWLMVNVDPQLEVVDS